MGVRIIVGSEQYGTESGAVLFDSTTGWAFGPVFADLDRAEAFLAYVEAKGIDDVRKVDNLVALVREFAAAVPVEEEV